MYQTSDSYKQLVYTDSTKHLLNIYIEGNKVNPDHIFDFKSSHILFSNDEFTLGSVEAKLIEFKIHINSLPSTYNNFYIETGINDEIVPIGFFILDSIEKDDNETIVTIKAIDYMTKFEFNYDGSTLKYPCTTLQVLQDICLKAGVELGYSTFLNSEKQIAVYDNTVSAREYVSYISEQAGGFACIGRDGKLYIKTIGQDTAEIDINKFQDFIWGDKFKVSGISYEDGIRDFKFGNSTNNVININSNNMYITDEEQVRNIFNQINNFECYSFEGTSIIDPAIDLGDIIIINGKRIIYQGDLEYVGKFKASISSKIQPKTKEETTRTVVSEKTKVRRVQSEINQLEGTITQLTQETSENSEKITKVEQDVNKIQQTVEETLDFTEKVEGINELILKDSVDYNILKFVAKAKNVENLTTEFAEQTITFVVDTNSRMNPSNEKIEYSYEINPLREFNNVSDQFVIEHNEETKQCNIKILRYIKKVGNVYTILTVPEIEILAENIDIQMFRETTYVYLKEYTNWEMQATYMSNPNLNEYYASKVELESEIRQTAESIELEVSKKIDATEFATYLKQNAETFQFVWNQLSQYIQLEGIEGQASLNIYNDNDKKLMSLNKNGQDFFDVNGNSIGRIGIVKSGEKYVLAFAMNIDWDKYTQGSSMAWGYFTKDGTFLPVFHLVGTYGQESSEYGGEIVLEGSLSVGKKIQITEGGLELNDYAEGIRFGDKSQISNEYGAIGCCLNFASEYGHEFYCGDNLVSTFTSNGIYLNRNIIGNIEVEGDIMSRVTIGNTYWSGYNVIGLGTDHKYMISWTGTLNFYVDSSYVGNISDKRLKKEIKQVDDKFIDAISELEIKQFKADNRNGQISFGIIAQELIEVFKKYNINPNDYEILGEIQYNIEEDTKYYKIEYTQFLVLKQLANDRKIEKLEKKDLENTKIIQELIKRINKLEEQN